jgi:hypothetical protein
VAVKGTSFSVDAAFTSLMLEAVGAARAVVLLKVAFEVMVLEMTRLSPERTGFVTMVFVTFPA